MVDARNKIVIVQHIWGIDNYIAMYDNGDAVMFDKVEEGTRLDSFIKECTTSGWLKTITFPVKSGANTEVKCKQTLYSPILQVTKQTNVLDTATDFINGLTKGGIQYVIWRPYDKSLRVRDGAFGACKTSSLPELASAPSSVHAFIIACLKGNGYALKREYQGTVGEHGRARVVLIEEYLFSAGKVPKEFKGAGVDQIPEDDLREMKLI